LKQTQKAIKDANLEYEKNKEAHKALMKVWYNPKTQKRREFDPEKTQILKDESHRIHEQYPILSERIDSAEKYLKHIKQRIRNDLYYDHIIPESKKESFLIEYGPKASWAKENPTRDTVWLQTTSDEEISSRPKHITSGSSSDDLFSTTEDEEEVQPSPLSVPYEPEEAPPPPEEEIPPPPKHVTFAPHPPGEPIPAPRKVRQNLAFPANPNEQGFFSSNPQDTNIPLEQQVMTPENLHRYATEAEAEHDKAIHKLNELGIQLDQERQKKRIFREAVKSNQQRGITPDQTVYNNYRKSRLNARYIRMLIKDNENNVQPPLRQKLDDLQTRLRILSLRQK
jgi:hypothetical protein